MAHKPENDGSWGRLWREALVAISLGWDLAVPIFGGVLLGYFLDRWLDTGYNFTLGLLVAGIAIGYYNIARFIQRINRRDQEDTRQYERKRDNDNGGSTAK